MPDQKKSKQKSINQIVEKITENTKPSNPDFQTFLRSTLLSRMNSSLKAKSCSNTENALSDSLNSLNCLLKMAVQYSNSQTLYCALQIHKIMGNRFVPVFTKSLGKKRFFAVFLFANGRPVKVIIEFQDSILDRISCSCANRDYSWCSHKVAAVYALCFRCFSNVVESLNRVFILPTGEKKEETKKRKENRSFTAALLEEKLETWSVFKNDSSNDKQKVSKMVELILSLDMNNKVKLLDLDKADALRKNGNKRKLRGLSRKKAPNHSSVLIDLLKNERKNSLEGSIFDLQDFYNGVDSNAIWEFNSYSFERLLDVVDKLKMPEKYDFEITIGETLLCFESEVIELIVLDTDKQECEKPDIGYVINYVSSCLKKLAKSISYFSTKVKHKPIQGDMEKGKSLDLVENSSSEKKITEDNESKDLEVEKDNKSNEENEKVNLTQKITIKERQFFKKIVEEGKNCSYGLLKDFCGCECHKVIEIWALKGKRVSCSSCIINHSRDNAQFKNALVEILTKIHENAIVVYENFYETQNCMQIFTLVSKFVFYIREKTDRANQHLTEGKREIIGLIKAIFSNLFLSFNISFQKYIELVFLLKSWREIYTLEQIPEEGWYGKAIELVFTKEANEINENSKSIKKRLSGLFYEKRYIDGLLLACSVNNYPYISKFLATLGRIGESVEVISDVVLTQFQVFEIAKIISKTSKAKAFDFCSAKLSIIKKKSRLRTEELEWIISICDINEGRCEKLEALTKELSISMPEESLKTFIMQMEKNGIDKSAVKIVLEMFLVVTKTLQPESIVWALKLILRLDSSCVPDFVKRLCEFLFYHKLLARDLLEITVILEKEDLFGESARIGNRFLELFIENFKKNNKSAKGVFLNNFVPPDTKKLIMRLIDNMYKDYLAKREESHEICNKTKDFLTKVFDIKNVDFLLQICEKITKSNFEIGVTNLDCLRFGKLLFAMQFTFTASDKVVRAIQKWLLDTTLKNNQYFPGESGGKSALEILIKHEETKEKPDEKEKSLKEKPLKSIKSTNGEFSLEEIVKFLHDTLLKVGNEENSQLPLVEIADFMICNRVGLVEEAFDIIITALKKNSKYRPEVEEIASKHVIYASEKSKIKTAMKIAQLVFDSSPTSTNFKRIKSFLETSNPELDKEQRKSLIEKQLNKLAISNTKRAKKGSIDDSIEILSLLIRENASDRLVAKFLREECHSFKEPEKALEMLKKLVFLFSKLKGTEEITDSFWFCAFHFNIIVATLKGTTAKSKEDLVEFMENSAPSLVQKTAATFSKALALVIEKKQKFLKEDGLDDFFSLLSESRLMFEKALKRNEWDVLIKSLRDDKSKEWLKEPLQNWLDENRFSAPTIFIDE